MDNLKKQVDVDEPTAKNCTLCGELKPLEEYFRSHKGLYGRAARCKACIRALKAAEPERFRAYQARYHAKNVEKIAAYNEANRERDRARSRSYYAENRDEQLAKNAAWRAANLETKRALDAAYRAAHREELRLYHLAYAAANREESRRRALAWAKANPEKVNEIQSRRRARKRGSTVGPVDLDALWTGLCAICGDVIDVEAKWPHPDSKSIDHIVPLSKGGAHEQGNLRWTHLVCNLAKGDRLPE